MHYRSSNPERVTMFEEHTGLLSLFKSQQVINHLYDFSLQMFLTGKFENRKTLNQIPKTKTNAGFLCMDNTVVWSCAEKKRIIFFILPLLTNVHCST